MKRGFSLAQLFNPASRHLTRFTSDTGYIMAYEIPSSAANKEDEVLIQAINSDSICDIERLIQNCNNTITKFSDQVLNWSLLRACHMGYIFLVEFLLQVGANLEVKDDAGNTPLMICSEKGNLDLVKMLLNEGADVNATNKKGNSVLFLANSEVVIHLLLNCHSLNVNHQNIDGYTALMVAVETWDFGKVIILIDFSPSSKGQRLPSQMNTVVDLFLLNNKGESSLDIAHRMGLGSLVELLYQSHNTDTHPLLQAAVNGDLQSCIMLFNYKLVESLEVATIQPNILCVVLNVIKNQTVAVGSVETDLVRRLCETGVNVSICPDCSRSPMDIVLDIGSYDLAEVLCQHGAVIPHRTVVSLVQRSNINFIPLFANYGAAMNQSDVSGRLKYPNSALDIALKDCNFDCANALLYHGAKIDVEYVLNEAIDTGRCELLEFLKDCCLQEAKTILESKFNLFNKAVTLGNIDILELLFKLGANINGINCNKTPLMNAIHPDVVKYLLRNGADVNKTTNTNALINSLSAEYLKNLINTNAHKLNYNNDKLLDLVKEIIRLLLDSGANLETTKDNGNTALIESVRNFCHVEIVQMLLDKCSNINATNILGQTALHATLGGQNVFDACVTKLKKFKTLCQATNSVILYSEVRILELVKLLLANQAEVNKEDILGNTPLLHAIYESRVHECDIVSVAELLLSSGANVNHRNKFGMSALVMAAQYYNPGLISLLIKMGANVNDASKIGQTHSTALSILLNDHNRRESKSVFELLDHGARANHVQSNVLFYLIIFDSDKLIHRLIVSGLCPSDVVFKKKINQWPTLTISPFAYCIMINNLPLAKYFLNNWYITQSDIKLLSRDKTFLVNVSSNIRQFLTEASAQPMRLELLSFITVSTAVGTGPDREDKVKKLSLPTLLLDYLMFRKVTEPERNCQVNNDLPAQRFSGRNVVREFYNLATCLL